MASPLDPPAGAFFDLSPRAKVRVSGEDRQRYLNGQITNDLRKVTAANVIAACVLNAKGRMDAHVFVSSDADDFLLDADPEVRQTLPPRLERYIIADDVQTEDVTERFSILHVLGATLPELPANVRTMAANRFRTPGHDVWSTASAHDELFERLAAVIPFYGSDESEIFRIEQGIPRWGRELTGEILPPEANLEESCVDYEKGCYIGQETISRMKMSGQRNKKLCGLISLDDLPLEAGMKLFPIGVEEKEVGWITSAGRSKRLGKEVALGFMKRPFYPSKFKLDGRDPRNAFRSVAVRVEIVDLPFVHGSE